MDYGKSGGPKQNGREPRPTHYGAKGADAADDARKTKEELLARMKAAAEARKK